MVETGDYVRNLGEVVLLADHLWAVNRILVELWGDSDFSGICVTGCEHKPVTVDK